MKIDKNSLYGEKKKETAPHRYPSFSQCRGSFETLAVADIQGVNEMRVPDAWWTGSLECIKRIFNRVSQTLDEIRGQKEAGAVEAVVAMYANQTRPLLRTNSVDEIKELLDFSAMWGLLGYRRKLVVRNATFF